MALNDYKMMQRIKKRHKIYIEVLYLALKSGREKY